MKEHLEYTIKMIDEAVLQTEPYPFLEIEDIFDNSFYADMIRYKPQGLKHFRPLSKMYSDRYVLELGYGENVEKNMRTVNFSDLSQKTFWKEFQNTFIKNRDLAEAFVRKYKDYLDTNRTDRGKINCRISRDLKGYSIGVHRDKRDKVFSALFYIPDTPMEDRKVNWGTQILVPNRQMVHTDSHHAYKPDGTHDSFDLYKAVTFEPNKMFSWCVTKDSYHGVAPTVFDGYRDSIAFFMKQK